MPRSFQLSIGFDDRSRKKTLATFSRLRVVTKELVRDCVKKSALAVERGAKRRAPVDTGRLRSSISSQFFSDGLTAEVGSDVDYAAFMEYGTGRKGAATFTGTLPPTYRHGGPFFPPTQALANWARRHKVNAFVIARSIFRAGGVAARPYLGPAWAEERKNYEKCVRDAVGKQAPRKAKSA